MIGTPKPDASQQPGDELRFRAKFFRVGCILNVILFTALAAVMVVFLVATISTLTPSTPGADEAAIKRVLNAQVEAWNKGELDNFMDGYWRDEKLTFTSGDEVQQGWDATRERYHKRYFTKDAKGKMPDRGNLTFSDLKVESLSPNVALVRGRYHLKRGAEVNTGRFTLTFHRFPDGWKITSDHTSAADKSEKAKPDGKK
jgi:beta-aspartyl-peptidase (threonine type)